MTKSPENGRKGGQPAMRTPPIVSPQAWQAGRVGDWSARVKTLVSNKKQREAGAIAADRYLGGC